MPTYRITISGRDYDVSSDRELSDTEAYQYAQQQADQEPDEATVTPEPQWADLPGNILPSAGRVLRDTAGGLGAAVMGLARPASDDEQRLTGGNPIALPILRGMRAVPSMVEGVKGRLGDYAPSRIKNTLITDPVGVVADIAGLAGGGAGLARGTTARVLRGAAKLNPVDLAVAGSSAAARGLGSRSARLGRSAMASALKVPDVIRRRNPTIDIPQQALEQGAVVSGSGITRGADAIDRLESQVGHVVAQSPATLRLTRRTMPNLMREAAEARSLSAVDPAKAAQAPAVVHNFLRDPNISTAVPVGPSVAYVPKDLPVSVVQQNKVRLNRMLANKFGQETTQGMTELNQAMRADLRENIANAVPEIQPINEDLGRRYAVQDALEARVPVAERHNMLPMRAALGALVSPATGPAGKIAGLLAGAAIDNPEYLSRAAIQMHRASQRLEGLSRTTKALQPYANMATVARAVTHEPPSEQEARQRGQLVTDAVREYLASAGSTQSPQQITQGVQQVVDDVSLLTGGVAQVTRNKPRAMDLVRGLWASHTTEAP